MNFSLRFEYIADQPAQTAIESVTRADKKPVGDLKIYDLMFEGDEPLLTRIGVYLFFSPENECLYAGKNSALSFIERIPWHFAIWETSWMNRFLKGVRKQGNFDNLLEAADYARNHQLLLIPMGDEDKPRITPLEKFFRLFLEPTFNHFAESTMSRYRRRLDLSKPLYEVLEEM